MWHQHHCYMYHTVLLCSHQQVFNPHGQLWPLVQIPIFQLHNLLCKSFWVTSNRGSASTSMVRTTPAGSSGATCPASLSSSDYESLAPAGGRLIVACFPPFCPAFFGFPFFWGIQKTIKMKENGKKRILTCAIRGFDVR